MFKSVQFITTEGKNIAINPAHVVACVSRDGNTDVLTVCGVMYMIADRWSNVVIQLERGF